MPSQIPDRYIWLGLGAFSLLAYYGIRYALTDIIGHTQTHEQQHDGVGNTNVRPEDLIGLDSLKVLADSPNVDISNAAKSLIISRFLELPNRNLLLAQDFRSIDPRTREQARLATRMLGDWHSPPNLTSDSWAPWEREANTPPSLPDLVAERDSLDRDPVREANEEGTAGPGWPRPRSDLHGTIAGVARSGQVHNDDGTEAERRRRRREAVIVHEGGGAIREEDIIRPRGSF